MAQTSAPIRATTQQFVEIEDIDQDMVVLRNGGATMVIETTAVNFGLLAEEEQDALIYSYAALLNSLSFPIQISILSKRMDISTYISEITRKEAAQTHPLLKSQLQKYKAFIQSLVKENKVLEKKFYVIIPFSPLELGAKGAFPGYSTNSKSAFNKEYVISRAKAALIPKKDHLVRQLARIGLKAKQLTTQELVELFYGIYNPQTAQTHLSEVNGYTKPLVEGARS